MRTIFLIFFVAAFTLPACYHIQDKGIGEKDAYVPIYATEAGSRQVSFSAPQPIRHGGKIVLYNNLLFQIEQDSGIHVFNVSNPVSPQRVGFIRSLLCKELAVKNNTIITNNMDDMVVIDFSNTTNIKEVKRLPGEFPEMRLQHPPQIGVYFVCPDASKGIVVGWKLKKVKDPMCSR